MDTKKTHRLRNYTSLILDKIRRDSSKVQFLFFLIHSVNEQKNRLIENRGSSVKSNASELNTELLPCNTRRDLEPSSSLLRLYQATTVLTSTIIEQLF